MIMIHHIVGGYGLFPTSGDGIMRRKIIWQRIKEVHGLKKRKTGVEHVHFVVDHV